MIASRGPAPFLLVRIIIAQVCVSVNLYFIELNSKNVASGVLKQFATGDIDIDISGFPPIILLSACNYQEGAIFLIRKEMNNVFCLSVVPCDSFSLTKKDNNTITFSSTSSAGGNIVLLYKH